MVITSLVENTSCRPDVGQEHGLSLFIQSGGHAILFDFGQSELFCENASALGADLNTACCRTDITTTEEGCADFCR